MSFMLKKKKYKFEVDLMLQELSAVPFVNGIIFAKVRLLDGGTFVKMSPPQEVKNNCVKWDQRFKFSCKMTANANTGVLESCICRVSVRKEVRGGRSFEKLGFANLNLAEFAGAGLISRRYLLEGYDAKHRQDNSMLQITLEMILQAGDPLFKTPVSRCPVPLGEKIEILEAPAVPKKEDYSGDSLASGSSGFGSLTRNRRTANLGLDYQPASSEDKEVKDEEDRKSNEFELGHSRNSSCTSQHSKGSGYSSLPSHSRQSSAESGHQRNLSSSSTFSEIVGAKAADRKRPTKKPGSDDNRMDSTRVNAKEVIKEVFEATSFEPDDSMESTGLKLSNFICDDGRAVSKTPDLPEFGSNSRFQEVPMTQR